MEIVRGQRTAWSLCYEHVLISISLWLTVWGSDSATPEIPPLSLPLLRQRKFNISLSFCMVLPEFSLQTTKLNLAVVLNYSMAIPKRTMAIIPEEIAHKNQCMSVISQDTAWLPYELFLKTTNLTKPTPKQQQQGKKSGQGLRSLFSIYF